MGAEIGRAKEDANFEESTVFGSSILLQQDLNSRTIKMQKSKRQKQRNPTRNQAGRIIVMSLTSEDTDQTTAEIKVEEFVTLKGKEPSPSQTGGTVKSQIQQKVSNKRR